MRDAVAAECRKIWSIRSTYLVLSVAVAFVLVGILISLQVARLWDGASAEQRSTISVTPLPDLVAWAAALCLAVLGVLMITSEYRTGMIRTSLLAVPGRWTLLGAKAIVAGLVALAVGEVVSLSTFVATRLVIGDRPIEGFEGTFADELPGLIVTGSVVAVYALLGLGLGALLRSTAGAIVLVVGIWHIIPIFVAMLPEPWNKHLGSFMLGGLPARVVGRSNESSVFGDLLSPPAAVAMMAAYAVVPLLGAAFAIRRRDA
ncbi:ABC transporter permease subunit [Spirillospora sp. CA-294931]|uniref:ABC transporter permease subunit n=1 Tax=Spirillospora sp. CA-294931 TaxID=3240042 RepID=UPI003D9179D1